MSSHSIWLCAKSYPSGPTIRQLRILISQQDPCCIWSWPSVVAYDLDGACRSRIEGNQGVTGEGGLGVCRVAVPPRVVRYESIAVAFALLSPQPILESSEATTGQ